MPSVIFGQEKGLRSIESATLQRQLNIIASDSLEGRRTGEPGYTKATKYIESELERIGITKVPGMSSYFQSIDLVSTKTIQSETYLSINDMAGVPIFKTDSILVVSSDPQPFNITDSVVFVGYGITDSRKGYDDYAGMNVKDQGVLFMSRSPWDASQGPGGKSSILNMAENIKIASALGRGTSIIFYVLDPGHELSSLYEAGIDKYLNESTALKNGAKSPMKFNLVILTRYTATKMMEAAGKDLNSIAREINSSTKPGSGLIEGITVSVNYAVEKRDLTASNVIGYIEGKDKKLKESYIVYTAHLDHIGRDGKGGIYNGADDNGSGTVALLEIAEAFREKDSRPSRSVIFVWTAAEEMGLFGANEFVTNPPVPLSSIFAEINLDMIGRTINESDTIHESGEKISVTDNDGIVLYYSSKKADFVDVFREVSPQAGLKITEDVDGPLFPRSDHIAFHSKGIPSYFLSSGLHADYHTVRDKLDMIDYHKIEMAARLAFLAGLKISQVPPGK